MSRLGKSPLLVPKGVDIKADKTGLITVKGPKATLTLNFPQGIQLKLEGDYAIVELDEKVTTSSFHGLHWALLRNAMTGVSTGFEIKLTMIGVGYRAAVQGTSLELQVGYSFPIKKSIPESLQVAVEKGTTIIIKGSDKQEIGQFAATVRAVRPPEPYKGKGIRYENEYVRKKEGKAAKAKSG